jgi:hypothetical protein
LGQLNATVPVQVLVGVQVGAFHLAQRRQADGLEPGGQPAGVGGPGGGAGLQAGELTGVGGRMAGGGAVQQDQRRQRGDHEQDRAGPW